MRVLVTSANAEASRSSSPFHWSHDIQVPTACTMLRLVTLVQRDARDDGSKKSPAPTILSHADRSLEGHSQSGSIRLCPAFGDHADDRLVISRLLKRPSRF